jgi:hypothetical protein
MAQAIMLETALKSIARKARGEVLAHADTEEDPFQGFK